MSQSLNPTRNSAPPTTLRGSLAGGLVVAALLHAGLIAITLFTWQHRLDIVDETAPVVPVDLVTIADKTNVAPTVQRMQRPEPKDDVKPPPQLATPTPTPAPTPPPTEAAPDLAPTPKPADIKPAPVAKPVVKPDVAPKPAKPDKKKPKTDDFSALLNTLTAPAAAPRNARTADRTVRGAGAMNAETMDLIDALKNQIAQCWSPPIGAAHPERYVPTFRIALAPDGSVLQAPQLTASSPGVSPGDPFEQAAEDAARRAIVTCAPYKLPADKYTLWRDITIDFDPHQMVQ